MKSLLRKRILAFSTLLMALFPGAALAWFPNWNYVTGTWNGPMSGPTTSITYDRGNLVNAANGTYLSPGGLFPVNHPWFTGPYTFAADYVGGGSNPAFYDQVAGGPFQMRSQWTMNVDATNQGGAPGDIDWGIVTLSGSGGDSTAIDLRVGTDSDPSNGTTVINGFSFTVDYLGSTATIDPGGWTGRVENDLIRPIVAFREDGTGQGEVDVSLSAIDHLGNPLILQTSDFGAAGTGYDGVYGPTRELISPSAGVGSSSLLWDNFGNDDTNTNFGYFHGGGDLTTDLISSFTLNFVPDDGVIETGGFYRFSLDGASFSPAPVPEPSRALLVALMAMVMLGQRRR